MEARLGTDINGRATVIRHNLDFYKNHQEYDKFTKTKFHRGKATKDPWRDIDKKCLFRQLNSRITSEIKSYDRNLNERKKRLRNLLCEEDNFFHDLCQKLKQEHRSILKCKQAENESAELKQNEEEFLAKKKLQLDVSKCKEIRHLISMRQEADTRRMQELQIKEKEKLLLQEKEAEEHWHKLLLEDVEKRKKIEEARLNQHQQNKLAIKEFLESQMVFRKEAKKKEYLTEKEKEQNYITDAGRSLREIILDDKNKKKQNMSVLKNHLAEQIESKRQILQKDKFYEIQNEISLIESKIKQEEEEIKRKELAKKISRKEMDSFNKHLSNIKQYRNNQMKNDYNYMNEVIQKQIEEHEQNQKLLFQKRQELLQSILNERHIQIKDKIKETELAKEKAKEENKFRIYMENKITEERKTQIQKDTETKKLYKRDLEKQIHAIKNEKEKELSRQKANDEELIMKEQMMEKKCKEIMEKEFNTEIIHPFTKVVKMPKVEEKKWYPFISETKYTKY